MKLKKAVKKDIEEMLSIVKENNPKYSQRLAISELNEMFSKSFNKPTYIVIKENNEIASFGGFNQSWVDSMIFNIFWVNTRIKYQKKGYGIRIVKEIIKTIKKNK